MILNIKRGSFVVLKKHLHSLDVLRLSETKTKRDIEGDRERQRKDDGLRGLIENWIFTCEGGGCEGYVGELGNIGYSQGKVGVFSLWQN